jgi:Fungal specific transcription factor domain
MVRPSAGGKEVLLNSANIVRPAVLQRKFMLETDNACTDNCAQLAVQYLLGCSAPQQSWVMIGIGIRVAQDVGAHRRKYKTENITVEDELWKRAFWYVPFSLSVVYMIIL